ncbi:hypothetical protein N4T77_02865 [Clostridium sp. CX1]|uniref:hypothetical protein n=1 Tax=Clostridium sp. CX1 TaxID=2978346 RepID=UPI0021C00794|nr:hypothetical protein [Clostridium sp. CX1]MCT8975533.1 hypothetical protein [Clostridium sp. CX1]
MVKPVSKENREKLVNVVDILMENIKLLDDWNKQNKKTEPEQCRKNIETMCEVAQLLNAIL